MIHNSEYDITRNQGQDQYDRSRDILGWTKIWPILFVHMQIVQSMYYTGSICTVNVEYVIDTSLPDSFVGYFLVSKNNYKKKLQSTNQMFQSRRDSNNTF